MKRHFIKTGVMAALLSLAAPAAVSAQQIDSIYVTPRFIYSYQMGDMSPAKWRNGDWSASALGGEEKEKNFAFGLAVGSDLGYASEWPVRIEGEYVYRSEAEFSKGPSSVSLNGNLLTASQKFKIKAHSLMVNAFYDFNTASSFTPYIGAGLGGAYLKTDYRTSLQNGGGGSASISQTDWNLAWNVGGGVAFHLNENAALDFGYRYVDLGDATTGNIRLSNYSGSSKVDYTAHEFSIGLRLTGF